MRGDLETWLIMSWIDDVLSKLSKVKHPKWDDRPATLCEPIVNQHFGKTEKGEEIRVVTIKVVVSNKEENSKLNRCILDALLRWIKGR